MLMLFAIMSHLVVVSMAYSTEIPYTPLIIGGKLVSIKNFPYMGSIIKWGFMHHCGCAILDEKWAVSAAHCFYRQPLDEFSLRTGTENIDTSYGQHYDIEKIIMHPNYTRLSVRNDIALLKVKTKIVIDFINTAPIPIADDKFQLFDGETGFVTGWGHTQESGSGPSDLLQSAIVPILSADECKSLYANYRTITPDMMCAGYPNGEQDACQGDSGGPLAVRGHLVGVVSWGRGCGRPGLPGVYANISYFSSWIQEYTMSK